MVGKNKLTDPILSPSGKRQILLVSLLALLAGGTSIFYSKNLIARRQTEPAITLKQAPKSKITKVAALGRLEPEGESIKLSASPDLGGAKVDKLLVKEGEIVHKDQTIAILDGYERQKAQITSAKQDIEIAKANLAVVKAGAKQGEIAAQQANIGKLEAQLAGEKSRFKYKIDELRAELLGQINTQQATISRLKAQLGNAQREHQRYQQLAQEAVISDSNLDQVRLKLDTNQQALAEAQANYSRTKQTLTHQIEETQAIGIQTFNTLEKQIVQAKETLTQIKEVRPVDVQKAQAQLDKAQADYTKAKEDLNKSIIKAPFTAQILKIYRHPGEGITQSDGVVELGQTDKMLVVAEVYESDISQIKTGQRAIIKSENGSFNGALKGNVIEVGYKVGKKDVLSTDPAADVDVRVIEVKIKLNPEDSKKVNRLTNSKVTAEIITSVK